jgi:hypothetical protein
MKKAISYSLFGYNREKDSQSFDFHSYLRGLLINIRLNRLLYPGWDIYLNIDEQSYHQYMDLFDNLPIVIKIQSNHDPLCLAMLWRLAPCFETNDDGSATYSHVICRDLDSPPTYRERQCVEQWIEHDKTAHAITDSVSHNIQLMGGMIGFRPEYFTARVAKSMDELIGKKPNFQWQKKGTDQTFLNHIVLPCVATTGNDSITQHYILGHGNTFLSDWHNSVPEIEIPGVDPKMAESNDVCGHIGAAGYYPPPLHKFLNKHHDQFIDIQKAEQPFADIFYWRNENLF